MSTVANYAGNFLSNPPPFISNYAAIASPWGTLLKPGGRVAAYLRSTGAQDGEDHFAASGCLVTTLSAALKRCRSGMNDIVYVLPGDVQSISTADFASDLVAGTQIISCGTPGASNNPTWTWTATGSTFLLDVANVSIVGMNLNWAGIDNVAAPMTISAAGCSFVNNHVTLQSAAASAGCVQGLALAAGANQCKVLGNKFLSDDAGEPQSGGGPIAVGTSATDGLKDVDIVGNYISAASAGDTIGTIDVITTCTDLKILHNFILQLAADANTGIRVDDVVSNGVIAHNRIKLAEANTLATTGVIIAGTTNNTFGLFDNLVLDDVESASGALSPAVGT